MSDHYILDNQDIHLDLAVLISKVERTLISPIKSNNELKLHCEASFIGEKIVIRPSVLEKLSDERELKRSVA